MEKNMKARYLRLLFPYLQQNLFNIKKHLALVRKKNLAEDLAWLTQKTDEPKSNKGNFTFPTYTVNVIEL